MINVFDIVYRNSLNSLIYCNQMRLKATIEIRTEIQYFIELLEH
jgi:hypothetical protein